MAKKITKKVRPQKIIKRAQRQQRRQQHEPTNQGPKYDIPTGEYVEAIGRRKVATARVRIYEKTDGDYIVNDQLASEYFSNIPYAIKTFVQPFELTGTKGKFAVTAVVEGSGLHAQLDAIVHGLARALVTYDPAFKGLLKEEDLTTRDPRMKETRKPGRGGRARAKRQSPKR